MPTSISEFGTPSTPFQIAAGSDGNLYSTALLADAILRTTPGGVTTSIAAGSGSHPLGITAGAASMFFTGASDIGELRLDTQAITHFALPAGSAPTGGIVAAFGDVWYTYAHGIGRLNTSTGAVTLYATAMAYSFPLRLTAGGDQKIWFTEANGNNISRLDPSTGSITQFALPEDYAVPVGVTAGPDGNVWFVSMVGDNGDGVYRITPDGTLAAFHTPTAWSQPQAIVTGPDGNLWVAEYGSGKLAKVLPDGTMTEFDLPTAASGPYGIAAGAGNTVWFTESSASKIGVLTLDVCPRSVSWDGGGDGVNWTDVLNWSTDQLPGACDDVYIHTNPSVTIVHAAGSESIRSLHSDNAISFSGALTLAADSAINHSLTFSGALNMAGGFLALQGGGDIAGNVSATVGAGVNFKSGFFQIKQNANFVGAGVYTVGLPVGGMAGPVFHVLLGDVNVDNFRLAEGGTLSGPGNLTILGTATWTGGTMSGMGITRVNTIAAMTISGTSTKILDERTLENGGTISLDGIGLIASNDAIVNNRLGATFDIRSDADINKGDGALSTFNNDGVFRKSGGTRSSIIQIDFNNQSTLGNPAQTVEALTGTLWFQGSGVHSARFFAAMGADILFAAATGGVPGVQIINQFTTLEGGGDFRVNMGAELRISLGVEVSVKNFRLGTFGVQPDLATPGILTGPGTLKCLDTFLWYAGRLKNVTLINSGDMDILGFGVKFIDSSLLRNEGTIAWFDGTVFMSDESIPGPPPRASLIQNVGSFSVRAGGTKAIRVIPNFELASITNEQAGTFSAVPGSGITLIEVPFLNKGSINVNGEVLEFGNGLTQQNSVSVGGGSLIVTGDMTQNAGSSVTDLQGGDLIVSGHVLVTNGTINLASGVLDAATIELNGFFATLTGAGTIVGDVLNAGNLYVGSQGAVGSTTISGNYTQSGNGLLTVDVLGSTPGTQYDQLIVTAEVNLGGFLAINRGTFSPVAGSSFRIIKSGIAAGAWQNQNNLPPPGTNMHWEVNFVNNATESFIDLNVVAD
ncbi:MAG: hypothetical protein K2R98_13815 [Gemmataceae bacterium]|nr:hypothetical protein [Gemmataceae bacterium]